MTNEEKFLAARAKRKEQEKQNSSAAYPEDVARFLAAREERRNKAAQSKQTYQPVSKNNALAGSTAKEPSSIFKTSAPSRTEMAARSAAAVQNSLFSNNSYASRSLKAAAEAANAERNFNNDVYKLAKEAASYNREGDSWLDNYAANRMNAVGPFKDVSHGVNTYAETEAARNKYNQREEWRIRDLDIDKINRELDSLKSQQASFSARASMDYIHGYTEENKSAPSELPITDYTQEEKQYVNNRIAALEADKKAYDNLKAADEFNEKYANDPEFKAQVDAYNAKRDEFKNLPYYEQPAYFYADAISSGVMQAAKTANDTLKLLYDASEKNMDNYYQLANGLMNSSKPRDLLAQTSHIGFGDNPVGSFLDSNAQTYENAERNHDMMKYAYDNELLSKLSDGVASTVASLPMYAAAVATGGTSAAGQMLTANTYNAATANTAKMLSHSLSTLAKDPNYWSSFISMYAPSYENAKAQGADELQAGLTAFLNSFAGSIVEIGGGIQAIPTSEKGIAAFVKNLADEGKEEVIQGIIEQLTNKAIHAPETPWFSLDDENAVINPSRAVDEFLGGAFGAALIGGGSAAYRHIAENSFGGNLSARGFAEKLAEKTSKQTKQNTVSDIGKPVTEIYTEKPAAVAVELDENGKEHNRPLTVSVKDGQLTLTDEQGGSVEPNENAYVDREALGSAAVLADLAENYGMSDDAVNAMINTVPQTLSIAPEDYVRYYNRIYDTAAKGVEVDKVLSQTDGIQTVIGAEAANAAAYAGARQYRAQQSAYNADIETQLANQQHNESGSVIDETKGAADLAVRKVADAISGKTGYTIRLVDGSRSESGERGSFSSSKGEIVVDVSSGNAVSTVLHETAHYIELNAPEDFKAMADEIRNVLSSKEITTDSGTISMLQYAADNYARVYSERYGKNVTAQQVMAEITADSAEALLYKDGFLESLLSDEHTMTELAKNDKSAFARFMDKVREIIATIKEYLNGKGRNNSISKVIEENAAAIERIEKLYMQGLENAKKNYDSTAKAETGEEAADNKKAAEDSGDNKKYSRYKEVFEGKPEQKFSLSDPLNAAFNQDVQDKFENDVDDVLNGNYTSKDPLMLGTTPTVFRQIGLSALPVVITKNHVYSIAATEAQAKVDGKYSKKVNYHGLGAQTVKQIYSKISNPLAIIAAQDITVSPGVYSAHRVVAIVDLSINGKQVIAPVEVDADIAYQKDRLDVNLVATYYDRSNIASMLRNAVSSEQNGDVGFYYIDKKRAANLLKCTGVQFPWRLVANNSNGIIHRVDEKVNRKIDTVLKSQQFIRWFGDWQNSPQTASKVVNDDGTPKVVYHGTDNGGFNIFDPKVSDDGISLFFSDSEVTSNSYAGSDNQQMYKVYLSLKNPYIVNADGHYWNDLGDKLGSTTRAIAKNAKAQGYDGVIIQNVQDMGPFVINDTAEDFYSRFITTLTGGNQTADFELFENEFDGMSRQEVRERLESEVEDVRDEETSNYPEDADEINSNCDEALEILDEMFNTTSNVYIAFSSNQIKSATDNIGTFDGSNPDIRYSLSDPLEETKNLIAVHNLREDSLMNALSLGGLPMPSIAVIKAESGHEKYGNISLVFDKATIDPQLDSRNKVYGSDAWTPTAPPIEYKVNADKLQAFENNIAELSEKVANGIFSSYSVLRSKGIDDTSSFSTSELAKRLTESESVRAAYIADTGKAFEPVYSEKEFDRFGNNALEKYIDAIGEKRLASIISELDSADDTASVIKRETADVRNVMRGIYEEKFRRFLEKNPSTKEEKLNKKLDNSFDSDYRTEQFIRHAWDYHNSSSAVSEEIDRMATRDKLFDETSTADVKKWIEEKLDGILGEAGIYNGKKRFTSSGNSRTFEQLHYSYTLENIVKAMNEAQKARGEAVYGVNASSMLSVATPSYNTIGEVKADSGRLKSIDNDEYKKLEAELDKDIENAISLVRQSNKPHSDNEFDEIDIIGTVMMYAAETDHSAKSIKSTFAKNGYTITDKAADAIRNVFKKAAAMPTGYFEAKPQRAVDFSEVKYAIVPDTSSASLVSTLEDKGVQVIKYNEAAQSRADILNSLESVKFSLQSTSEIDYPSLLKENTDLKKQNEALAAEMKLTEGHKVSRGAVEKLAGKILREYKSDYDRTVLADNLEKVFNYIADENADAAQAMDVLSSVAKAVIEQSSEVDASLSEQFSNELDAISSTTFYISPSLKSDLAATYGSYKDFVNSVRGSIKTTQNPANGTSVDTVWSELTDLAPGIFDEETYSPLDMMIKLEEFVSMCRPQPVNPYEMSTDEAAADLAATLFNEYFDTPEVHTFADKQQAKLNAALSTAINESLRQQEEIREQAKKRFEENYEKLRLEYSGKMHKLRESLEWKNREDNQHYREQKEKLKNRLDKKEQEFEERKQHDREKMSEIRRKRDENLAATKQHDREVLAEVRRKRDENLAATKQHDRKRIEKLRKDRDENFLKQKARYMDMRTAERERRAITAEKAKIRKIVDDFNKRLFAPTDNRYVPKDLFKTIVNVCSAIDLTTGKLDKNGEETKATRTLFELQAKYEALKSSPDYAYQSAYDAVLSAQLDELSELTKDKRLSDLNLSELTRLHDILKAISKTTREAVSVIRQGERISVYESGERVIKEIKAAKGPVIGLAKIFKLQTLAPERVANYMVDYEENAEFKKLVKDLTDGEEETHNVLMAGYQLFDELIKSKKDQNALKKMAGLKKDSLIDVGLKDSTGNAVLITEDMLNSLYMHSLNAQNRRHIAYGGINVPDIKLYLKGKYTEAYNHGTICRISEEQLLEIVSKRSELSEKWCNKAKFFFNEFCKDLINETSEQLNGYRKAEVENYYPISSDRSFTNSNFEALVKDATIEGAGFLKKRVYGSNPIYLENMTNVIERQLANVAKYSCLAVPVRNFTKVYNMTEAGYTESVKHSIASKWGTAGTNYVENLLTDLQSGRSLKSGPYDKLFEKIKNNAAQAILSFNFSVTLKQAASFPTAAAHLGWKAIIKALTRINRQADLKFIEQYTPELWFRNRGNSTKELGEISKNKGFMKSFMDMGVLSYLFNSIQKMDVATVRLLWTAAECKVEDEHPDLKRRTDEAGKAEFYKAVAKEFDDTVHETQPNYTVMQRPDILRSPNKFANIWTTFATQPLQNLGITLDAIGNFNAKVRKYNEALKTLKADGSEQNKAALAERKRLLNTTAHNLALAASSQLVAAVVFNAMGLAMNALMHNMNRWRDDEDELTLGTIMAKLGMGTLETLVGSVPGGSDLCNLIEAGIMGSKYYGVESLTMSAFSDLSSSTYKMIANLSRCFDNSLTTEEKTKKVLDSMYELAKNVAYSLGIPYDNISKTVVGIWKHYEDIANGEFFSFKSDIELTDKERLFAAKIAGDTAEYDRLYGQYKAAGKSKGEIDAILAAQLKDTDKRIGELAYAFGHDVKRYEELVAELKGEGWDWDVISRAMNKYTAEMKTTLTKAAALRAEGDTTSGNYEQLMLKCMEYQQAGFEDSEMEQAIDDYTADLEAAEQKTEDSFADSGYKSIYSKSQLYTAIKDADSSTAQKIYADLLKEKAESLEAQGYSAEEAEKKAKSSLKSALTAEFKQYIHDEHISSGKDLNATGTLRTMLVKYFGYTYGEVNKWLNE